MPMMEPNAMPSRRLEDELFWALAFCPMLRSGTLEGCWEVFVSDFLLSGWGKNTDFSMRGAYADPRLGLRYEDDEAGITRGSGPDERTLRTTR
jgi:hypothetical protein